MKHTEIALGSTFVIWTVLDAHPFLTRILSAVAVAAVSTVTSKLVERLLRKK